VADKADEHVVYHFDYCPKQSFQIHLSIGVLCFEAYVCIYAYAQLHGEFYLYAIEKVVHNLCAIEN
jgi:hypothetical protein